MSKHYTFYDGVVTTHDEWVTVSIEPNGTVFYSPTDNYDHRWGVLGIPSATSPRWSGITKAYVPKEFLTQLLLMGVPC